MSEPAPLTPPRHLRLYGVEVVVRDPDRSLDFYVNLLGFRLIADVSVTEERRMIAVAPPDGSSILVLVQAPPGTVDDGRSGRHTGVFLVTNDIAAQYGEWSALGVHFAKVPTVDRLDSRIATFADPDGNTFNLVQSNQLTEQLESERPSGRAQARRRAPHCP